MANTSNIPYIANPHPYENVPLLLISGVGRSGTTAVRLSVGMHPDIHSTERENNIIYDVADAAYRNCVAPSRRYAMRVTDAEYDAAFRRLMLSILWPTVRKPAPKRLLAFSDLTPDRAEYVTRMFPQARIVYLVRNGIEVVSSRMRHEGFKHQPFEMHASVWSASMDMARWGEGRPDFLIIRHESLVAPGGSIEVTARICEFLGLPFSVECERNLSTKTYHPTAELKPTAGMSPLAQRASRWKDWSPEQIRTFVSRCSEAMEYFGYERPWSTHAGSEVEPKMPQGAETHSS